MELLLTDNKPSNGLIAGYSFDSKEGFVYADKSKYNNPLVNSGSSADIVNEDEQSWTYLRNSRCSANYISPYDLNHNFIISAVVKPKAIKSLFNDVFNRADTYYGTDSTFQVGFRPDMFEAAFYTTKSLTNIVRLTLTDIVPQINTIYNITLSYIGKILTLDVNGLSNSLEITNFNKSEKPLFIGNSVQNNFSYDGLIRDFNMIKI